MLSINTPADANCASVTEISGAVQLDFEGSKVTLPTLPREGNYTECVYLLDSALGFVPGPNPVMAAHLSINGSEALLTLYPLPETTKTQEL